MNRMSKNRYVFNYKLYQKKKDNEIKYYLQPENKEKTAILVIEKEAKEHLNYLKRTGTKESKTGKHSFWTYYFYARAEKEKLQLKNSIIVYLQVILFYKVIQVVSQIQPHRPNLVPIKGKPDIQFF